MPSLRALAISFVTLSACTSPAPSAVDAGASANDIPSADSPVATDTPAVDVRPPRDVSRPFAPGPYGVRPRDLAGPVTLRTSAGDFRLEDEFTGDESFVFAIHNGSQYSRSLFGSSIATLLDRSPRTVHYFILASGSAGVTAVEALRSDAESMLDGYPDEDRTHWRAHLHFGTEDLAMADHWVARLHRERRGAAMTAMNTRYDPLQFAIDRAQRIREVGMLGRLATGGVRYELAFLAREAEHYDFEAARERRMASQPARVVQLFRDETVVENTSPEVELPDAATMATYDTLEVDLTTNCANHRDGECGAWDYLSHLFLCDAPTAGADAGADAGPPRCDTEIARWITTYWREGRWVTDISPMLAHLRAGGRRRFRWYASRQWDPRPANYIASLSLRFANRNRGVRPVEARRVYTGGAFNSTYGERHPPVRFTVPEGTRRVELYTLVTGHGADTRSCAEFCNHTHHFAVNTGAERSILWFAAV